MGICCNVGSAKWGKTFLFSTLKILSSRDTILFLSDKQMSNVRKKHQIALCVQMKQDITTISVDFLPGSLLLTFNMYRY